jgi:hypothetical protein
MRRLLVSAFLADSIQHIHSLRASGVMSCQAANACGSEVSAFSRSAGASCTTPPDIFGCNIDKSPEHALCRRGNSALRIKSLLLLKVVPAVIDPIVCPFQLGCIQSQIFTVKATNIHMMNLLLIVHPSIGRLQTGDAGRQTILEELTWVKPKSPGPPFLSTPELSARERRTRAWSS